MEKHSYNVQVTWNSERKGMICSPELNSKGDQKCIEVATPPEFPKGIAGIWSPEHLFTAAIASCFMTTFLAIADNSKLEFFHFECASEGILEEIEGRPELTEIILSPNITVNEKDSDRALRILKKSESACIISRAVRAKIVANPTITIK